MTRPGALLLLALVACGRSTPAPPPTAQDDAAGAYRGRTIAPACSHRGAAWLDRPEREVREQPERVLDLLAIAPGMSIADVGAGTGYFTVRLARRVGPTGRVLATDLQPEMLAELETRVAAAKLTNVQAIRATARTAELPAACCDLALLVDVYHELADPSGVMAGVRAALRPGGRLVLVEYRGEDPAVAIKPEHKMTLAQIRAEVEPLGFTFVESIEALPDQRIVVFVPR